MPGSHTAISTTTSVGLPLGEMLDITLQPSSEYGHNTNDEDDNETPALPSNNDIGEEDVRPSMSLGNLAAEQVSVNEGIVPSDDPPPYPGTS